MKRSYLIAMLSTLSIAFVFISGQSVEAKQKTNYVYAYSNTNSEFNVSDTPVTQRVANKDFTANIQDSDAQLQIKKGTVMNLKDGNNQLVTIPDNTSTLSIPEINSVSYPYKDYYYSRKDYKNLSKDGAKWAKGLSKAQYKAIGDYSDSGYQNDNTYLRTGTSKKITKTKQEVHNIQNALKKFNLKKPMTVYRGLNGSGYSKGLNGQKSQIGSVYSDNAFQSTSIDKNAAIRFLNMTEKNANNNILIKLNVPSGYNGAYISSVSQIKDEKEYLINSKQHAVITRIQKVNAKMNYKYYYKTNLSKSKSKKVSNNSNNNFNYTLVTMNLVK
ncbi:ADP-ribosyltransferase [Apilactobacillus quenuiae]|uniref:ADP-ribosyltransferase n=1 Tax=Apilactobacillus quenuiae TaxID=2008377 RepID=UPI000D01D918|nr:ADP-ribosyltransferase [Apilactobacillus quenuiae]